LAVNRWVDVCDDAIGCVARRGPKPGQQGLTLVHFSAQRERFLWDRGCVWRVFNVYLRGVRRGHGACRVCLFIRNGLG
jgi:hypothetical protein